MHILNCSIDSVIKLEKNIILLKIKSPEIASEIKPGQFLNIKVSDSYSPLLRRPFSVCDREGDFIYIMFNIMGEGTKILSSKRRGSKIDILGPLGHGFNLEGDYDTAVLVMGGLGAAPFPYVVREIIGEKEIISITGGRNEHDVITYGLSNIFVATDDGSMGFRGNVVELLKKNYNSIKNKKIKIFACGPSAMLRALQEFALENNIDGEAATECAMACGFGICQGCPIESATGQDSYLLVCKDGPVFNFRDVVI
ncbi:MAG: dihydroorotate dehydrogenase electron transfer subunit [Ignavibacteriaceae bacterium]|nr:dihydroorotate dehydrogenase electron transfer subunit [Ignavibacteriaceae bacterium]